MKASEIFKEFGEGYKYLTQDGWGGSIKLFKIEPCYDNYEYVWESRVDENDWKPLSPSILVEEFDGCCGFESILCVDDLVNEETFTAKDMIEFIKWTNVIYRDLSHTLTMKDVDNVNELLELFEQTREWKLLTQFSNYIHHKRLTSLVKF